jgi:hypothetical protein
MAGHRVVIAILETGGGIMVIENNLAQQISSACSHSSTDFRIAWASKNFHQAIIKRQVQFIPMAAVLFYPR